MKVFWVTKRLAFGSAVTTRGHVEKLRSLGITHIINLRWSTNARVHQFPHIWLRFHDDAKPRPRWFYRRALNFYRKAMEQPRTKLLVMCHHGRCRSASLVCFLMRATGRTQGTAKRKVALARPIACIIPDYLESGEQYLRHLRKDSA